MLVGLFLLWTPDRTAADLSARYLAAPGDLIDVPLAGDTVRLHVRDDGPPDAPALLFLHGFGASLHTWEPWAVALAGSHRVVRLDLPGSGLSPPDPTADYTDARSLALIEATLDHLNIARASVIGNSMGGRLAWSFAAARPARVDKLVLLAPDGFASAGFAYDQAPEVPVWLHAMRVCLPRFVLRMGLAPAYVNPEALTDALLTRYHDLLRAPGARHAMLMRLEQAVLTDPVPRLRSIQAPTLLLWGEQDAMIPVDNASDYLAALQNGRLVRLPGMGHLPHEEDPQRSLPPVREFLQR